MTPTLTIQNSLSLFSMQAHQLGNASEIARRSLAVALLRLMQGQDFHTISITQLTKTAGVSRMTYYRHYQNKIDILRDYLQQIDDDYLYVDLSQTNVQQSYAFLVDFFDYLKQFEISTQILTQQGFEYLIVEIFNNSKGFKLAQALPETSSPLEQVEQKFQQVFAAGMLCNTYLYWVKTGQTQTPEQLATWLITARWHELFYKMATNSLPLTPHHDKEPL